MVALGDTFLLAKPGQSTAHLWIVVTCPDKSGKAIIVNITGQQTHSDKTTILNVGDHQFITKASVVFYADSREGDAVAMCQALNRGMATSHQPCSAAFLTKVQAGILASPQTPPKIKTAFQQAQKDGRDKPPAPKATSFP